jgi:hypothetical protein
MYINLFTRPNGGGCGSGSALDGQGPGGLLSRRQKPHCNVAQVGYVAMMNWQQVMAALVVGIAVYGLGCHWRRGWRNNARLSCGHGCSGCPGQEAVPSSPKS